MNDILEKMLETFKKEHPRGMDEIKEVLEQDENVRKHIQKIVRTPLNNNINQYEP